MSVSCWPGVLPCRILTGVLPLLMAVFPGCAPERGRTLDRALESGTLKAGYSVEPPFAFVDDAGRVTGESPEVLRVVVEQLGIPDVQWVRLDFDQLLPSLLQGRIDVISSGMFGTPARATRARASLPSYCAGAALVTRIDLARVPEGFQDLLQNDGWRLVVLRGSVEELWASRGGFPHDRLLSVPDLVTGAAALQTGRADLMAVTMPTARLMVRADTSGRLSALGPFDDPGATGGCGVLLFRPTDEDLVSRVDCILVDFLGTEEHLRLIEPLGFTREEVPPPDVEAVRQCEGGPGP